MLGHGVSFAAKTPYSSSTRARCFSRGKNAERLRHPHRRSIRCSLFFPREENTVILDATPHRATQRRMALQPSKVTFIFVPNIPVALWPRASRPPPGDACVHTDDDRDFYCKHNPLERIWLGELLFRPLRTNWTIYETKFNPRRSK